MSELNKLVQESYFKGYDMCISFFEKGRQKGFSMEIMIESAKNCSQLAKEKEGLLCKTG